MNELGIENTFNLTGGILAWKEILYHLENLQRLKSD
jgi:rhodanese-related sulfurtransferase